MYHKTIVLQCKVEDCAFVLFCYSEIIDMNIQHATNLVLVVLVSTVRGWLCAA